MNASTSIPTSIKSVDFAVLTSDEILKLSTKRITNSQTFDPVLMHPQPNGLYDTALGAILDHPCATCHLDINACPGHCGHIELPVHVYHCQFIDQAYKFLKAQCAFCRRMRISRPESKRLTCKLKLIRHGLLKQAEDIELITEQSTRTTDNSDDETSHDSEEEDCHGKSDLISRRDHFTRQEIRKAREEGYATAQLNEAVSNARRNVIQELMYSLSKARKCPFCAVISPPFRKNRSISIYQKPLSKKDADQNARNEELKLKKTKNPLQELNEETRNLRKKLERDVRRKEAELRGIHSDEGIADMDSPSQDEDEITVLDSPIQGEESASVDEEDEDDGDDAAPPVRPQAEDQMSGKSMMETETTMAKAKKRTKSDDKDEQEQKLLAPEEIRARLTQLFRQESALFSEIYSSRTLQDDLETPSADMFFIKHLLVPPNKYRKETKTAPDEISEAADNAPYRGILSASQNVAKIYRAMHKDGSRSYDDLQSSWIVLQGRVNALVDVTKSLARAAPTEKGIKQKLEKKEGIMRMNVMGKRVNFAARSVISPDPNLEANEVGVPPVFAKTLTYPEPVTTHNFSELKRAVLNGAERWPGAVAIETETGQVLNLRRKNIVDRQAIANSLLAPSASSLSGARNKKVYRHLNNGDVVIMNRQPTLHKPSMMAHRARILPGEKTIRMHYANTNSYNADFDGDEMNMHFPQNEVARAEAMQIADTDHQYLSTTSGAPLRGLIQDHISMAVWLSCLDSFYTQEEYHELLYACLRPEDNQANSDRIKPIEPTIWKPTSLWTGKDIITTILMNIQPEGYGPLVMESKCGISVESWGAGSEEGKLRVCKNHLVTGTLDKTQIGAKSGGLVHMVFEVYGHTVAGQFISILGRLLTRLLNTRAFSCGIEDLIVTKSAEKQRQAALGASTTAALPAATRYVSLEEENPAEDNKELTSRLEMVTRDEDKLTGLDGVMRQVLHRLDKEIVDASVPKGLVKPFPQNQMQTMTSSGAKGSHNNAVRISANLGQQNLEGKRVPIMVSGKTLPSFKPFEPTLRSGGFITDRFLTGIRPQEYYFHAMSGREGLVDTAVKTSRSGYLQRCVIKGLEGCKAGHDGSVRDADGSLIQALYGEDALEVSQQAKITDFGFVAQNTDSYMAKLNLVHDARFFHETNRAVREYSKNAEKTYRKTGYLAAIDPVTAVYAPTSYPGSSSERYFRLAKEYIEKNPHKKIIDKKKGIKGETSKRLMEMIVDFNYTKAVVPPGDAVGVVAGQSIGEPSTQMTLNTFHMAGSAQNVTLGIPRLREILMAATRNIKTPQMILHFIPEIPEEDRRKFANGISRRSLAEVIDEVLVEEELGPSTGTREARMYRITLKLFPRDEYESTYSITSDDVAWTLGTQFVSHLDKLMKATLKKRAQAKSIAKVSDSNPEVGKAAGRVQDQLGVESAEAAGGDSDRDEDGEDDATNAKNRANLDEGLTYDEPDESDIEIERAGEREASPEEDEDEDEDEGYGGSETASREGSPFATATPETPRKKKSAHQNAEAQAREDRIKKKFERITGFHFNDGEDGQAGICTITFEFNASTPKLLLLPLIKAAAHSSLIQELASVSAANFIKPSEPGDAFFDEGSYVSTEGVNLVALQAVEFQDIIDPHRTYTNSVHHMLSIYGVEAARETTINELHSVFKTHGISVDRRHLTLVADYTTRAGGYIPFNRSGIQNDSSLFKKMSFETTVQFLRDTSLEHGREDLVGPSARLTVGKVGRMGTGSFDVMYPVMEAEEKVKEEDDETHESNEEL